MNTKLIMWRMKCVDFKYFVLLLICGMIFLCIVYTHSRIEVENKFLYAEKKSEGGAFTINTPSCKIPYLHPYDKSILEYLKQPEKYICNNGIPALFESDMESIKIIEESLPFYNVTNINDLVCCYKSFWRDDPTDNETDYKITYNKNCQIFVNRTVIKEEFIKVTCSHKNRDIYTDMFAFVPITKLSNYVKKDLYKNDSLVNILVLGLDALSRLNFNRQLPKTIKFLKHIGGVEMLGYNKVGDNTFPNIIPVLTGNSVEEITKGCWPTHNHHFDNCSFIWKSFKEKGYVTAFGEDSSWMGIFNYMKKGFKKQPWDYAYNYFDRETLNVIGNLHFMNVNLCQGSRWLYKDHLKYLSHFVQAMSKKSLRYFGFFWQNSLSHDDLNLPRIGDDEYYLLIQKLHEKGFLNNTVLVVLSDHGIRWGGIRSTFQGMMEERLPFLYVYLPEWYRQKYHLHYSNLQTNSLRLTTPFDLHETFVHLINSGNSDNNNNSTVNKSRGVSLLREISGYRSCEDAGIVSHWCTCQPSVNVDIKNKTIETVANFTVSYINSHLSAYSRCANLTLNSVLSARIMENSMDGMAITDNYQVVDYTLSFTTVPGNGLFEATIRYISKVKKYSIVGSISRLNLYGKQSSCISDYKLKLYCYCI
ncbi:uncharacterized protein [Diabrotica undecimpunctata]|uniref:uncharacterized protein n=1 Tax=Diabrotica undecimpunctata TaxID=50387 RepID=UPI003B63456F